MTTKTQRASARRAAALLGIGANETRVLIIGFLKARSGAYVQEIVEELEMTQSAISHQLRLLEDAGVVASKKEGRDVFYTLSKKAISRSLLRALRSL